MTLFSAKDRSDIEAAIAAVEQHTSGEIVVAILARSQAYTKASGVAALAVTLAATLALHVSHLAASIMQLVIIQASVCYIAWVVANWSPALRRLLTPRQRQRGCQKRAFELFAELGIYKTRGRSGVLLLISELERQVVILGDEGISSCLGTEGWQQHVAKLIDGIRHHRAKDSVIEAIASLGAVIADKCPPGASDSNELPDTVVQRSED